MEDSKIFFMWWKNGYKIICKLKVIKFHRWNMKVCIQLNMKTYSSFMFVQLAHNEVNFPLETWNYGIGIRKYYYFLGYTVIANVCLVMSCVYILLELVHTFLRNPSLKWRQRITEYGATILNKIGIIDSNLHM